MLSEGWIELKDDLLCSECISYYKKFKPVIGDTVQCLIHDKDRQLYPAYTYKVCDIPKEIKHSVYVNVSNGWQARLDLGEYTMDYWPNRDSIFKIPH